MVLQLVEPCALSSRESPGPNLRTNKSFFSKHVVVRQSETNLSLSIFFKDKFVKMLSELALSERRRSVQNAVSVTL